MIMGIQYLPPKKEWYSDEDYENYEEDDSDNIDEGKELLNELYASARGYSYSTFATFLTDLNGSNKDFNSIKCENLTCKKGFFSFAGGEFGEWHDC